MIISVFLILLALAIFLIVLGYSVSEGAYSIIGFIFLFVLSTSIILPGNIEYKIGTNTTASYIYGDNFSGYHWDYSDPPSTNPSTDPYTFHEYTTEIDLYQNYDNATAKWFGIWLAVISVIGIFISSVEVYNDRNEED